MTRELGANLLSVNDSSRPSRSGFMPLKDGGNEPLHTASMDLLSEEGPYSAMQPHWFVRGCCTRKHWCFKGCCYRRCCSCCCIWTFIGLFFLICILILFIGAAFQRANVAAAGDTGWVYNTLEVCSYKNVNFENATDAHDAGQEVQHCGQCGQCSNKQDIDIYNNTAATLTNAATKCAFLSFIGEDYVRDCLNKHVGFTSKCNDCWVDNVMCDRYKCQWICLVSILSGQRKNDPGTAGKLNPCLECDEKLCGPAFIRCAGANRRRSGIPSDIGRADPQLCSVVDPRPDNITLG